MKTTYLLSILLSFLLCASLFTQDLIQQVTTESTSVIPSKISYQGVLTDNNGNPLDGSYTMQFALYTSPTGGSPIWSEEQSPVPVNNGIFNVLLGSSTSFDNVSFDVPYWLQITVEGSLLSPRIELSSSAYSFRARTVEDGAITTEKLANQSVTQEKIHPDVSLPISGEAGGDLTGNYPNPSIASNAVTSTKIANAAVTTSKLANESVTQDKIHPSVSLPISGDAGGDLTGTYPNPTVRRIQGRTVSTSSPSTGQVLKWTGSQWAPGTDESGIGGSGTSGFVPRWTGSTTLGNSAIRSNATHVGIGVSPSSIYRLDVGSASVAAIRATGGTGSYAIWAENNSANIGTLFVVNNASGGQAALFGGHVAVGGNLNVDGTLSKGGGSFEIDHPLYPQNMILRHSFVESPDMMNVYNGNTLTDEEGFATIELPAYFEALNRDFRYQLTVIQQFAQAIIAEEIQNNQFTIQTDKPNVKVSWQVTGIRKDPWAENNRIVVEEYKSDEKIGSYIHPQVYNVSGTQSLEITHY